MPPPPGGEDVLVGQGIKKVDRVDSSQGVRGRDKCHSLWDFEKLVCFCFFRVKFLNS